ncbi:MAG: hypothetical protein PHD32_03500 [Eubacteriales bacterium]|nr:hypothetical protein [Eubacteriales bacterium]
MRDKRRVIYYENELENEFSIAQITPIAIDGDYRYDRDGLWDRFAHVFWYRAIATPIAWLYMKLAFHHRVENRQALKACPGTGCFLYGNHTQDIGDAFTPTLLTFPREACVIVHPNNVSMPVLGRITPYLGALPLPGDMPASINFMRAIQKRIRRRAAVVIYPEAHIWPFYTQIRPFSDASFYYPVKCAAPVFCFTNTYQKRKHSQKPRIVTYIDGPFYPDASLPIKERKKDLRDRVYARMCERSALSDVTWIKYIRKEDTDG